MISVLGFLDWLQAGLGVSIRYRKKMIFFEVYQSWGLVLTTTSDRSWISDNVNVNDWYKQKLNPKFNENLQLCKSGKSLFAVFVVEFFQILMNRFF